MALRKGFAACSLSGMVGTGLLLSKGCPHPGFCSGCDSRAPNQLGRGQVHQSTWVPGHHLTPGHSCQQVSPLYNILWQPCLPSMGLCLLPLTTCGDSQKSQWIVFASTREVLLRLNLTFH